MVRWAIWMRRAGSAASITIRMVIGTALVKTTSAARPRGDHCLLIAFTLGEEKMLARRKFFTKMAPNIIDSPTLTNHKDDVQVRSAVKG